VGSKVLALAASEADAQQQHVTMQSNIDKLHEQLASTQEDLIASQAACSATAADLHDSRLKVDELMAEVVMLNERVAAAGARAAGAVHWQSCMLRVVEEL
jgi:hypothetical protein